MAANVPEAAPRRIMLTVTIAFAVATFATGVLAGLYLRPLVDGCYIAGRTGSGDEPNKAAIPNSEEVQASLLKIRNLQKGIREKSEPISEDLQMMQNLYNLEVNQNRKDPNSEECIRIRIKVDSLKKELAELNAQVDEMSGLDGQLCWVSDNIKSGSTADPNITKAINEVRRFLSVMDDQRRMKEGGVIPDRRWEGHLNGMK